MFVMTFDGTLMPLVGVGYMHIFLFDVYFVPKITMDLIFVSQLVILVILFISLLLFVMCKILNLRG